MRVGLVWGRDTFFLAGAFLAVDFFLAGAFLAVVFFLGALFFLAAGFLAAVFFFAAGFFAVGFLAADVFLAVAFLAAGFFLACTPAKHSTLVLWRINVFGSAHACLACAQISGSSATSLTADFFLMAFLTGAAFLAVFLAGVFFLGAIWQKRGCQTLSLTLSRNVLVCQFNHTCHKLSFHTVLSS